MNASPSHDAFEDLPILANLPEEEADARLREYYEALAQEGSDQPLEPEEARLPDLFRDQKAKVKNHELGHIAPLPDGQSEVVPVENASTIKADPKLRNQRVTITLNRIYAYAYPGWGTRHVLFSFSAENHVGDGRIEHVHFNQTFPVEKRDVAAVINYPIFLGLKVAKTGLVFRCTTVIVKSSGHEALLRILNSPEVHQGLQLAASFQPAIIPLSAIGKGILSTLLESRRNLGIQEIPLGLGFSNAPMAMRLAEGTYIAVQVPKADGWDWSKWVFHPGRGEIVSRHSHSVPVPYNYIAFAVTRYAG